MKKAKLLRLAALALLRFERVVCDFSHLVGTLAFRAAVDAYNEQEQPLFDAWAETEEETSAGYRAWMAYTAVEDANNAALAALQEELDL